MVDIIEFLNENKPIIDEAIKKYIPEKVDKKYVEWIFGKPRYSYNVEAVQKFLSEPVWDFLNRGGKRWRPALFILVAQALGGDLEKLKDFVVIPELVHNGSLIVDDIEDRSELRRGQPCLHKNFGVDVAINVGNMLYFLPLLAISKNKDKFDDKTLSRAYQMIVQELTNIHCGQGLDISWHNGKANADNITVDEYLQMCAYKTGTLARAAAKLAVVFSGGTEKQEEALGKFAETIGVAFQIQDDVLSACGKEFQEKKGFGDDITEGKRTLMIIYVFQKGSKEDKKKLVDILNQHTTDEKLIQEALDILQKYKAPEYAKEYARKMLKEAWKEVDSILKPSPAKEKLKAFADYLVEREI